MATPSAQPPSASPMTRSSTISTTWAHPTPGEDPESSLVAAVEGACNEIIYTVGAKGFLQEMFGSAERATPFARWMLEKFPMRQDVLYQLDDQVRHMTEDEIGGGRPISLTLATLASATIAPSNPRLRWTPPDAWSRKYCTTASLDRASPSWRSRWGSRGCKTCLDHVLELAST